MNRYSSYGPIDDQPLIAGDNSLLGTNDWDAAENLQPGQCQSAVNMDFTTQDAVTRGGFVALPGTVGAQLSAANQWVARTVTTSAWDSVAYGAGKFVAVASGASGVNDVMYSDNGVVWTTVSTGLTFMSWTCITFGGGLFVAGATFSGGPTPTQVATSSDGITWTAHSLGYNAQPSGIAYGNGVFVLCSRNGGSSQVSTSTDGATWTDRNTPSTNEALNSVAYGNGVFVVSRSCSAGFGFMYSDDDGATWTSSHPDAGPEWSALSYGSGVFLSTAGNGNNYCATSPDGITWTEHDTPFTADDYNEVSSAYGFGLFVVVLGDTGGLDDIYTTPDGITWTAITQLNTNRWRGIAYGNGLFAAVSSTGTDRAMTSTVNGTVQATAAFSDPNDIGSEWIMMVSSDLVRFSANGKASRDVSLGAYRVSTQSTIVQCNNLVYLFRGPDDVPLYWSGNWSDEFIAVPTTTPAAGFSIIPNSSQATYYQDRLWVVDGKDEIAASDVLDFNTYDDLANNFNLNKGSSDYIVATYPFGENSLVVFKHRSILLLQNVQGSLADVTVTEITRQVGCIGINAITTVGPDIAYMSDRNINLITMTSTNNSVQHKTLPLSRNISNILKRVNWEYAYKVSMAYFDNKLFVAVPLDNSTVCNTVLVYNFVTENWFGEWTASDEILFNIIGWAVVDYLGLQRLHAVSGDGRIFVTGEGQNDISGVIVSEISTSLVTRAYNFQGNNATQRRLWADLGTNRPTFSISSSTDGASETSEILTDQTYARTESWIFNDSAYDVTNANDDFNRAYRKDYSSGTLAAGTTPGLPTTGLQCGTGFLPEQVQSYRIPIITRRQGRLSWLEITNTTGYIQIKGVGFENHAGQLSSLVQV